MSSLFKIRVNLAKFWKPANLRTSICVLLLLVVLSGPASFGFYFVLYGYLPSPFFYDKWDTLMDFFHPLFWAMREGRYSIWSSVYPPINFLLLKALAWISSGGVQFSNAFSLRENAAELAAFIILIYATAPAFVVTRDYWSEFTKTEKLLIYLICITSTPFLFALERGNLVILCILVLPFIISGSSNTKAFAIAVIVNLKPYFVVFYIYYVLKKQWQPLGISLMASGLIFLLSGVFLDREYYLFFENLLGFTKSETLFSQRALLAMPSSVSAFAHVLVSPAFASSSFIGLIPSPKLAINVVNLAESATFIFMAIALILGRKNLPDRWIFAILLVAITNSGVSVGGYTFIFYLVLVPVFYEMRFRCFYLAILTLIVVPLDLVSLTHNLLESQNVYLTKRITDVEWSLGLGSLVRPILNLLLLIALSFECIAAAKTPLFPKLR